MKTFNIVITVLLFASSISLCQFEAGSLEIGLSGSIGTENIKYISADYSSNFAYKYIFISALPSYYIKDGLALEPELGISMISESSPALYLIGNISYTHKITDSKFALFGRAGYGASNAVWPAYFDKPPASVSNGMKISIVNLGAGFKYLISEKITFRCELNYKVQNYNVNNSSTYYNYSFDRKLNTLSFQYGFTILF